MIPIYHFEMDLSLLSRMELQPPTETARFVYPRKTNHLQRIRKFLVACTIVLIVIRKLYSRKYTTKPLLWDECIRKYLVRWRDKIVDAIRYMYMVDGRYQTLQGRGSSY